MTEIYRSRELQAADPSNLNRYFLVASQAIDKPPRRVVRAVLKFLRDRGEVVGRGADKGLEDAATLVVKTIALLIAVFVASLLGFNLVKALIPGL